MYVCIKLHKVHLYYHTITCYNCGTCFHVHHLLIQNPVYEPFTNAHTWFTITCATNDSLDIWNSSNNEIELWQDEVCDVYVHKYITTNSCWLPVPLVLAVTASLFLVSPVTLGGQQSAVAEM